MKYKDGVYPEVVVFRNNRRVKLTTTREINKAMDTADALSIAIAGKEAVCTAIFDGSHKIGSKHYEGNAFDLRTWKSLYNSNQLQNLIQNLSDNLGPDYDIVLHSTHLHIEYDPKGEKKK
jgi:hypothetical protein